MKYNNVKCPSCDNNKEKQLFHDKVWGGEEGEVFLHCLNCDVVFLFPFPSSEDIESFYANEFGTYMVERSKEMNWNNIKLQYDNLSRRELPLRTPILEKYLNKGSVVEIGSSTGFLLDYLKEEGIKCCGVEPSTFHAEFSRSNGNIVYDNITSLEEGYDNLIHYYVLEHVINPKGFLQACLANIRSGGRMIFEIPHRDDALLALYKLPLYRDFIMQKMHLYYHSIASIKHILNSLNLEYEIIKGSRYGLRNHLSWIVNGKPGLDNTVNFISNKTDLSYKKDMKNSSFFDYIIVVVEAP